MEGGQLGAKIAQIFKKYGKDRNAGLDKNETKELFVDMLQSQNKPYDEK